MPTNNWNASFYDQKHSFVSEYGKSLIPLLDPQPGESILDLGCGTGHLTQAIAESGAHAIGLDSSASMIETARTTYPDLQFLVADARNFSFPTPFDAVFSNAALHWIPEAEEVVRCIATALKPGGRFVAEFGGKGNIATIISALQQSLYEIAGIKADFSWYYPSIGEYTSLLERYGLTVRLALLFDRPTKLEDGENGLRNWLLMFRRDMLENMADEMRSLVIERTEAKARDLLFQGDCWVADYRRLRIVAHKDPVGSRQEQQPTQSERKCP
jgi:SAM-dependent methyltransferase